MWKALQEEFAVIFARDPAAKSRLEIILCYPGFHAILFYRLNHWLWKKGLRLLARWLSHVARFFTAIEIHPAASIGKHFFIDHGFGVVIGETAKIGNDVTLYHDVTLGGTTWKNEVRHPQLGNDIIVGAGAQLLGPIKIGDGARIGSNAVVIRDVASNVTVVGIPAHETARAIPATDSTDSFDAYATASHEDEDPLVLQMEKLNEEVMQLKRKLKNLEAVGDSVMSNAEQTAVSWENKSNDTKH